MTPTTASATPLQGIKVLDLSRILAGPFAGQILADLGAEVLKIEHKSGDDTRRWGPPFVENPDGSADAAYFHSCNRGKGSMIVDIQTAEGQETIKQLCSSADILIENFKLEGLQKYGLDYESLKKINPQLIYASITGFGQTGPYAKRAGYDFIIQGMSGIMSLTGDPDGPPQKIGMAYADIITGLYCVIGIESALLERHRSGKGCHIDLSLLDCMVGTLGNQAMNYLTTGISPFRRGNSHPNITPYDAFETKDSWFILTIGNDSQFKAFCQCIGLDPLADDPRFMTNADRLENRDALKNLIEEKTRLYPRDELLKIVTDAGVPAGPINTVAEALQDPHVQDRAMVFTQRRESDGLEIQGVKTPLRFNGGAAQAAEMPSPKLGSETGWKKD